MSSSSYNYIHKLHSLFIPRTPSAALQAASADMLPIEGFIYKSTALNPILKKPYNMDEIEWLLAKRDRDLETDLILKTVLSEISRYEDKEAALFAAESLNALEKEYNNRLIRFKEKIEETGDPEDRFQAAETYYQMARLNEDESTLSNFYMRESYQILTALENENLSNDRDRLLMIRVLLHLKLYDQAEQLLPDHKDSRLLRMEIAYSQKDIPKVCRILEEIQKDDGRSTLEEQIISFWTGRHE